MATISAKPTPPLSPLVTKSTVMNKPKAKPAPKAELFKTANAQTSFICEAMLGYRAEDGRVYNKIGFVMILRDKQNKALKTLRYFLDIPTAKVLFEDIWRGVLPQKYNEFKKNPTMERSLSLAQNDKGLQISLMNIKKEEKAERENLYFTLSLFQSRQLAISVLDHLRAYEFAKALLHSRQGGDLNKALYENH